MRDESAIAPEQQPAYDWDFFLAHAGADLPNARNLKQTLGSSAKVFLDAEDIVPGDTWATVLSKALHSSLIHVILVSQNTDNAYYEGEEIAVAVQLMREDPHTHRVVPVYLNAQRVPADVPYGLKSKHGLYVPDANDLTETRQSLLKTLQVMKQYEASKVRVVAKHQEAIAKITGSNGRANLFSGLRQAAGTFSPLLKTLHVLFVLTAVLFIACLFPLPLFNHDERMLALTGLGGFCALLLLAILGFTMLSLNYSKQIALENINAG